MDTEHVGENDGPSTGEGSTDMVRVRNAYKAYGSKVLVLRGLNLTVKRGSIYAFLGPSGSGKTTLLGCLVGKNHLDHGEIYLGVTYHKEVGYMPQETALLKNLSIQETMIYYGKVFRMTEDEIKRRTGELLELFDMPPASRQISTLSGGQQRRASLCLTLLHDPKLLILDEPTVGVDPLLSDTIWDFLTNLTKNGERTILLTTHYIEEARRANTVGMMREGVILVEGSPQTILHEYRCSRLEEVFLQLSENQELNAKAEEKELHYRKDPLKKRHKSPLIREQWFSFIRLFAHLIKNVSYLRRNPVILTFILTLPVVQCVLFTLTIGKEPLGLNIGVIDDEIVNVKEDCHFIFNCSWSYPVSCYYLDQLGKSNLKLVMYNNIVAAKADAKKGHLWGFMHIGQNYSSSLERRFRKNLRVSEYDAESSSVSVWLDMSNNYISNFIIRDLYMSYEKYLEKVYKECNWNIQASRIPIAYQEPVYGKRDGQFSEFGVPCILLLFSFYLPLMMVTAALLSEKRDGLLERSFISGVTLLEMIIGHTILCLIVLIVQILTMFIVIFYIFQHVFIGSLLLASVLCFSVGFCGMCYGFMVAIICDRDFTATYLAVGSFFPLLFLSGMIWPREGMHYLLSAISLYSPLTLSTDSFRAISMKAWDASYAIVDVGFVISIAWAIVFAISTYFIDKLKKTMNY